MKKMSRKPLNPGLRYLFETIERLPQMTDMIRKNWIHIAWRLNHIDLFFQETMEKGISNIQLPKRPIELNARDRMILIVGGLITRLKVSSKSTPYCWWNPFATSLALYVFMLPSLLCFNLKTYLQPTRLWDGEDGTKFQVPCLVRAANSSSIAEYHCWYWAAIL